MRKITRFLLMSMAIMLSAAVFSTSAWAQLPVTESFENAGAIPAGWAQASAGGTSTTQLTFVTSGTSPTVSAAFNGSYMVRYNSYSIPSGNSWRLYRTTPYSTVGVPTVGLSFAMYHDPGYSGTPNEGITVQYSLNGTTWTSVGSIFPRYGTTAGWQTHTVLLPGDAGNTTNLYVAFLFSSQYGNNIYMDYMKIFNGDFGTLTGTITNSLTLGPAAGISVVVNALPAVTSNASGVYTVTDIPSGTATVNATGTGYYPFTGSAVITPMTTTTYDFTMVMQPATVTGTVVNSADNTPLGGVKITSGNTFTYSLANGTYSLQTLPGSAVLSASKPGFLTSQSPSLTLTAGGTTTYNFSLTEVPYPTGPLTATLNSGATAVDLVWSAPTGLYAISYDDGTAENYTVWTLAGNLNALKFSAISYPAQVMAGMINIGTEANYAPGTTAASLEPFHVWVFDATGTGGKPGNPIGDPIEVQATNFGWNTFTFPTPKTVTADFYLVMEQGGIPPTAAGLAIDMTNPQFRSYAKYVSGNGPWLPADGNFMMRAIMTGMGGPLDGMTASTEPITTGTIEGAIYANPSHSATGVEGTSTYYGFDGSNIPGLSNIDAPVAVTGYTLWRLQQGQEANEPAWTQKYSGTNSTYTDTDWETLPAGPYRWAVKAAYPLGNYSVPVFSNVLGKNWTANVTINVTLSCDANSPEGTLVTLVNNVYPDTAYSAVLTATGTVTFPKVWKGNYTLTVSKYTYDTFTVTEDIMADKVYNVSLGLVKIAPWGLTVADRTLEAVWNPPVSGGVAFQDNFSSGNFTANGWTAQANWSVTASSGNPAPSAQFSWTPSVTNYSLSLTSANINGNGSPLMNLSFDINLSNFSTSTQEYMAIEISGDNGATWNQLGEFLNSASIPWTHVTYNLGAYANSTFKIRFRAHGANSFNINYWYIDNVKIEAPLVDVSACVLAYNFYLNGELETVTTDTAYAIPPSHVTYGQTYNACVLAVFENGYSAQNCYTFTAHYLPAPRNLVGTPNQTAAILTWDPPLAGDAYTAGVTPDYSQTTITTDLPATSGVAKNVAPSTGYTSLANRAEIEIGYCGDNSDAIGTGGTVDFIVAARFTADELSAYYGSKQITKLKFWVASSGSWSSVTAKVYQGGSLGNPGTEVYSEDVTSQIVADSYSTITLTTPIPLVAGNEYWVGYEIAATGGYPAGCDAGPQVAGKGQWIYYSGAWYELVELNASLTYNWNIKAIIDDAGPQPPQNLVGYVLYRDGNQIAEVPASQEEYWDMSLAPGQYCYEVTAKYDLTEYGMTGFAESLPEGPACVPITWGFALPFIEDWTAGSFDLNYWSAGQNWIIDGQNGHPFPAAKFKWDPLLANYSESLESAYLDATAVNTTTPYSIFADFELKLDDRTSSAAEKLTIEISNDNGNTWSKVGEFVNNGDFDWTLQHIDITNKAKNKVFKLRFRANGASSGDIYYWMVDNINVHVEYQFNPALNLVVTPAAYTGTVINDNHLVWEAPAGPAPSGDSWSEDFEGGVTPAGWQINTTNTATSGPTPATWTVNNYTSSTFSPFGTYHAGLWWDYSHQDEWLITPAFNADATTTMTFETAVYEGSTYLDHYYVKVSTDGGATWTAVWDASTLTGNNWNYYAYPYTIDLTAFAGENIKVAFQAVDGDGQGLWYVWFVDNISVTSGDKKVSFPAASLTHMSYSAQATAPIARDGNVGAITDAPVVNSNVAANVTDAPMDLMGYNVYRRQYVDPIPGTGYTTLSDWAKINNNLVTVTEYWDNNLPNNCYDYYVTVVYTEGESAPSNIDAWNCIVVGVNNTEAADVRVYPNPATSFVNIDLTKDIKSVTVYNALGSVVMQKNIAGESTIILHTNTYAAGAYSVKFVKENGDTFSRKFVVVK